MGSNLTRTLSFSLVIICIMRQMVPCETNCGLHASELLIRSYNLDEINDTSPQKHCEQKWHQIVRHCPQHEYERNGGEKILYIHIGKSAGTTVQKALVSAGLPVEAVHVMAIKPGKLRMYSDVVIAVREPVARLVSSFYWRSPRTNNLHHALSPSHSQASGNYEAFYHCFKSINDYAAALYQDTACGRLAREGEGHVFWNICAYLGGLIEDLRSHPRVFVVDTEHLLEDVNTVVRDSLPALTAVARKQFTEDTLPTENSYKKSAINDPLTPANDIVVRRFLNETGVYSLYQTIHEVAVNR